MDNYNPFTSLGWMLIILGVLFVALPYLTRIFPSLDHVPWWILWVYKRDGFYFATSPLLIILSLLSIILSYLRR
ncbi:MAG TPA: hypothetical protein ENJ36_00045 [Candidatus Bathyarchaeota archaeon]|nr:hypothetical protein [Candidatus Bathyarchaeota archaeon]